MAWVEYMRADDSFDQSVATEIAKDVQRLEMITARFSSIGSIPILKQENIAESIDSIMNYLEKRISKKVKIKISYDHRENFVTQLNKSLFEWVIENLCKNAVDAMPTGAGSIFIAIEKAKDKNMIQIDITDTGKGIPINQIKTVFKAGFTTKKRGWGLGLTLAQRIIEEYHQGKIWVLRSEINVGTTFRILLPLKK
jgi:signal transduction histidine kinase